MFTSCACVIKEYKEKIKIESVKMNNDNTLVVQRGLLCDNPIVIFTIQCLGRLTKKVNIQKEFELQIQRTS